MRKNNRFLFVAVPLAIILMGLTIYEYGYQTVQSEIGSAKEMEFEKQKILKKYLTQIADKPGLEAKLVQLQTARKRDGVKMIEGETPAVAAASLQTMVNNLITFQGGTVASERIEKPEEWEKFQIITMTVDATMPDVRALSDTLYAIETQTPYLVVRELDSMVRNYQTPKELTVKLKLSALTGGR
jgi:hypothetical protein